MGLMEEVRVLEREEAREMEETKSELYDLVDRSFAKPLENRTRQGLLLTFITRRLGILVHGNALSGGRLLT